MKKISFEELKDKDLFLDNDGKIVVKNKKAKKKFIPYFIEQTYYYVDCNYSIKGYIVDNNILDICIRNEYFVFETRDDAEEYVKYLKALKKYSHKFTNAELENEHVPKYSLSVSKDGISYLGYGFVKNKILFKSGYDCEAFIKEAGVDNIKNFMFDIWEE